MVGDAPSGRTRPYHSRYFAESQEGREARSPRLPPYRKPLVCSSCFGEDHEYSRCLFAGISCNGCGGEGHDAAGCPLYFMELSIRGHLLSHIHQRSQQDEPRRKKAQDKGRVLSQDSENSNSASSGGSESKSAINKRARRLTFSAVQCIVCGNMGHANCSSPPLQGGVCHCPRCSHPGHTAAECPRFSCGRQQGISSDAFDRKSSGLNLGAYKVKSPKYQRTKWQKQRRAAMARAAATDPWHPLHLQADVF